MDIIDRKTGKRVDQSTAVINKKLNKTEPIIRNIEKGLEDSENSPMDPPEAYDEQYTLNDIEYQELNEGLKMLVDEHLALTEEMKLFERALISFKDGKFILDKATTDAFNQFFVFFDNHVIPHNKKEERHLFPLLHQRLLESGEHSPGDNPETAVDLMEDDHVKFIQLGTLVFNLLGLGSRFGELNSRAITFDLAYNTGKELIELLRIHIFKEDNTLFPLAQQLLTEEEFLTITNQLE